MPTPAQIPSPLVPRAAAVLAVLAAGALALAAGARGEYAPGAEPASATPTQLGDRDSTAPAISRDGRYVVFRTESTVLLGPSPDPGQPLTSGLVRKDLLTGAVALVAPPGAGGSPSIDADGRYVLFETTLPLVPGDGNTRSDVYVRDMSKPLSDVGAYELVSSLDGPARSPVYRTAGTGSRTGQRGFGLSADGRTAVFWTDGESNLPAGGSAVTPRAQVFVRSLDRRQTRLVTRAQDDPTLPGTPVPAGGEFASEATPGPVLSGDGTTVAWEDTNPAPQIRMLPGEPTQDAALLWRDMSAGPAAQTRRITGIADPDDPACPAGTPYVPSTTATGPCYGPFASSEADDSAGSRPAHNALSISDDGRRVAFLSDAKRRPFDVAFDRRGLYVVDMDPGRSRKQATREPVSLPKAISALRPIQEATLSGDGRFLVFSSKSDTFDGPQPIGTFQSGDLSATNVFVLDLGAGSLERATRGVSGEDYLGALLDPLAGGGNDDTFVQGLAVDDDASAVAFQAGDGNLFVGDANGVADVQVVRRAVDPLPAVVLAPPAPERPPALPRIAPLPPVHPVIGYVTLGAGGVASVRVEAPAPGRLSVEARGRGVRGGLVVGRARRALATAATVTLRLRPSAAARRLLRRRARLAVLVSIRYVPRRGAGTRASRRYVLERGDLG